MEIIEKKTIKARQYKYKKKAAKPKGYLFKIFGSSNLTDSHFYDKINLCFILACQVVLSKKGEKI